MKLIAVNGSPRKNWNTAELLANVVNGASAAGSSTNTVHLYDLDFKGCRSCFACKYRDGGSYGTCAINDGLTPILERIREEASALVLGTPIYFGSMTGEARSFLERLLFPATVYSVPARSLFPRRIKTAILYTMNVSEQGSRQRKYDVLMTTAATYMKNVFGDAETLCCYDTYQFPDYSRVEMELYDPTQKAARKAEVFPIDCRNAYLLGRRLSGSE